MAQQDDDVPPFDPIKVAVFVLLMGAIAFAGWRFMRARAAVAAVAEASKDYRKLFPARSSEPPAPVAKPLVSSEAPVSGMGMLKIDDDMRQPKRAPAADPPPPQTPPQEEAPPAATVKAPEAAPPKPAVKAFSKPRLNSGAFSGLNGGAGLSGGSLSGGGGGAAPAAPAAPVMPSIPGVPAPDKK